MLLSENMPHSGHVDEDYIKAGWREPRTSSLAETSTWSSEWSMRTRICRVLTASTGMGCMDQNVEEAARTRSPEKNYVGYNC